MQPNMPGKRKGSHRKENIYALKRRGSVRCPRCEEDIFRGPRSNPVDELFILRHQARDQKCREMPVSAIVVAAEEFRDDNMNDHVNFEADRLITMMMILTLEMERLIFVWINQRCHLIISMMESSSWMHQEILTLEQSSLKKTRICVNAE